jgi:LDH2 family malate/lactate/ureidoglycolate dehydrogenase
VPNTVPAATAGRRLPAPALADFAERIFRALGTPHNEARIVADALVDADLAGHGSHGVMRIPRYAAFVRDGAVDPAAQARVVARDGAAARIDAGWGWGQPAGMLAVGTARELVEQHGVAAVTIADCNHIGRLGAYVERLAEQGLVGIALCNAEPAVAPAGGRERLLGTNPLALAAPRADGAPVVLDIATAAVAEGKLSLARDAGASIPVGLVVDGEGRPSESPSAFYDGGALLPFGSHKGSGISVFIEILGGILSGAGAAAGGRYDHGNGTLVLALDPGRLVGSVPFADGVAELTAAIEGSAPADPAQPVLMPGTLEQRARAANGRDGVPVSAVVWADLGRVARELGVDPAAEGLEAAA